MPIVTTAKLVNGSIGDPVLYVDFPGEGNAILFDAGELGALTREELRDVGTVLLSHFHMDHWASFDRLLRANLDVDKSIQVLLPPGGALLLERRIRSYLHQRFPFQKLRFQVRELGSEGARALFDLQKDFSREDLAAIPARSGSVVHETREARIRWAPVSHTVPCVSYAVDVRRGYRFDREKAEAGALRPGPWIARVLEELARPSAKRASEIVLEQGEGRYALARLVNDYFTFESAHTIAFVTDTRADRESWEDVVRLARGAWRLYCDCYYAPSEARLAEKHGHLTAPEAGALAREAGVESLWLIHLAPRYRGHYEDLLAEARAVFPATYLALPESERARGVEPGG